MNNRDSWTIETFDFSGTQVELIEFYVGEICYVMIFTSAFALGDEYVAAKEEELGILLQPPCYEVKFDQKSNFDSGNYYEANPAKHPLRSIRQLEASLVSLMLYHYRHTQSSQYLCSAENEKLRRLYSRLADQHSTKLDFTVIKNLGEEGLGYEIRTPHYKSKSSKD